MNFVKTILLTLIFNLTIAYSINIEKINKTKTLIGKTKDLKKKFNLYYDIAEEYWLDNVDSSIKYIKLAETIDKKFEPSLDRIKLYVDASTLFAFNYDYDISNRYLGNAISLSKKLKYSAREAQCYNHLATNFFEQGFFDSAILYSQKAIQKYKLTDEITYIAGSYTTLANSIFRKGNFKAGIDTIRYAIKLIESVDKNSKKYKLNVENILIEKINLHRNLVAIQAELGIYDKNLFTSLYTSLEIAEKLKRKDLLSGIYQVMGNTYLDLENYKKAKESLYKAIGYSNEIGERFHLPFNYYNLASVFNKLNNFDSSIWAIEKTYELAKLNKDNFLLPIAIATKYHFASINGKILPHSLDTLTHYYNKYQPNEISQYHFIFNSYISIIAAKEKKQDLALKYWEECYKIAKQIRSKRFLKDAWEFSIIIHKEFNNYKELANSYENYNLYKDSLDIEITGYMAEEQEVVYETQKKEFKIKELNNELEKKEIKRKNLLLIIALVSIVAFGFIFGLIYQRKRAKRYKSQKILAQKQAYLELVNDHTLTNILNKAQSHHILGDNLKSADVLKYTANFLRNSLKTRTKNHFTLSDEIELCNNYFDNMGKIYMIAHSWDLGEITNNHQNIEVPPHILLSCIENSIKHGIKPNIPIEIKIQLSIDNFYIKCQIIDNGKGINYENEDNENHGYGSTAVKMALGILKEQTGNEGSYILENIIENNRIIGCQVLLSIPYKIT